MPFSLMKKNAFFINAARGGLVNENALAQALNKGSIAAAAVDVVSVEPIRPDNPLLSAQNCLISPHIAWATLGARQTLMAETIKNIKAYTSGNSINVVNKKFLKG
jgi:glycerate dehydrogenase